MTQTQVVPASNGPTVKVPLTHAQETDILKVKIAELEARVRAAETKQPVTFTISVKNEERNVKGGSVMATGLGRFPVSLYYEQWIRLLDAAEQQNLRAKLNTWLAEGKISRKPTA
jgi:hypothetical protein